MKKLKYLGLLCLLSGCAYFIERIENPLIDVKKYKHSVSEAPSFCPLEQKADLQLVGNNQYALQTYLNIVAPMGKLDFLDHFALWSLAQLSIRPDQSSGTSRLQVLFNYHGENHYFDFFAENLEEQYPNFYGVEWILKKFGKKTPLESYALMLEKSAAHQFRISRDFAAFLTQNQTAIKEHEKLAPFYIRGNEVLKEEESFPKVNYSKLVKEYRKVQKLQRININTSLIPFIVEDGVKGSCNYDFNLYENSIFLIDKAIPLYNLYGLSGLKGSFLSSNSQKTEKISDLKGEPVFSGESKVRSSAVCVLEGEGQRIWSISNQSRDPGQHLYHLMRYGLARTQNASEVDKLIKHSRHLFLSDPTRLVIESGRSHSAQIKDLLKLDLPIYHGQKLGNIWALTQFSGKSRFIIDDRNPGAFICK